jgi:hypothetical protein
LIAKEAAPVRRTGRVLHLLRLVLIYLALFALLYFAVRNAPLSDIWSSLRQLRLWQIGAILVLNALVIASISLRWWAIVRADNPGVPVLPLIGYRLSVFGLSYFTPGPQVGGEPLQVYYLHRNHGVTSARATAAVIMDKLLELLANFILVCMGLAAVVRLGLLDRFGPQAVALLIPLLLLLMWPAVHIVMLHQRTYPVSWFLRMAARFLGTPRWARLIMISERMASAFVRRRPAWLLASLAFSLLANAAMAVEYFLFAIFLAVPLTAAQTLAGLTAAMLSFLLPLPGGLGALEASQVLALGWFGQPASVAISIALLMRGRDVVNGGVGLLLAGGTWRR